MLLSDRLKELGLKLTDLAQILNNSRPTVYRFIEYYEKNERTKIPARVLNFFNYIQENKEISRIEAMSFAITNIKDYKNETFKEKVGKAKRGQIRELVVDGNEDKIVFIEAILEHDTLNPILRYLAECAKILDNGDKGLTNKQKIAVKPLADLFTTLGFKI